MIVIWEMYDFFYDGTLSRRKTTVKIFNEKSCRKWNAHECPSKKMESQNSWFEFYKIFSLD